MFYHRCKENAKPNGYKEKRGKQAFKRNISERKKIMSFFEEEFGHLEVIRLSASTIKVPSSHSLSDSKGIVSP